MKINFSWILCLILSLSVIAKEYERNVQTGKGTVGTGTNTRRGAMTASQSPCNQEMMLAYGLEGHGKSEANVHPYCPSVKDNCCTNEDATTSMRYWLSAGSRVIEEYYETYLYSLKYLLGFAEEVNKLSDEMDEPDKPSMCRDAAQDFKKMNWNPQLVKEIYKAFIQALEAMGDIRKGFYCVLCDVNTQNRLRDFWSISNVFYQDRIYFNQEFCEELVDYTIRASYYQAFYLKRYLNNAVELMSCKNGIKDYPEYEVSYWTRKEVELCYQFKNKQLFFFCENYCENFHLTRGNHILDGNVDQLITFVRYFKDNRDNSFFDSDNNFLLGSANYVEQLVLDDFDKVTKDLVFFRATTSNLQLDKFKTDVLYTGGFNPFDSTEGSSYPLVLASNKVFSVMVFVGLFSLLIRKN